MVGREGSRWRRLAVVAGSAALALGFGSTLLAQSPPQPSPTPAPARTSTVLQAQPAPPSAAPSPAAPAPTAQPGAAQGQVAVVKSPEGLHLREGPGTDFPSLAVIPDGTEVPIVGALVGGAWWPVTYQGRTGFVFAEFVEVRAARPPASAPPASAAPSPSASPRAPAPSPTPAPSAGPPALQPSEAQFQEGVLLQGVFATDLDDMITVADEFQLTAVLRPPAGVSSVTMRLSGAPFLSASQRFDVQPGDNWLQFNGFKVDTENEPVLREEVIRKVGGTIPIRDGALVLAIDYTDASGGQRTATFQPVVREFNRPTQIAKVEYPDIKRSTGLPPNGAGVDNFYLRGDLDFHHPEDFYVRKLAVEAGRRGGVFPDDPELVADNIFIYINTLLGDAEPGDFNNDYNLARLIEDGTVKRGQSNGGYICIGQVYFMTSLTRTLGIPSRELNILVGRPNWLGNDGVWRVTWWQEGALQTWYNGRWNHYDLWLGFKGMNGYFRDNLAYQAWAAYDRRAVPFTTVRGAPTGLSGHDFGPSGIESFEFIREATKPGVRVLDMPEENGDPVSWIGFNTDFAPESLFGGPSRILWPEASPPILREPATP